MTQNQISEVIDSDPCSYPTPVPMDPEVIERHILCERQFKIAMVFYEVNMCFVVKYILVKSMVIFKNLTNHCMHTNQKLL